MLSVGKMNEWILLNEEPPELLLAEQNVSFIKPGILPTPKWQTLLTCPRAGSTDLTHRGNIHWSAPRGWWAPHRRGGNACQWPPWSGCWLLWDPGSLPRRNSLGPDVSDPVFYKPKNKKAEKATFTRSCSLKVWATNVPSSSSVMFYGKQQRVDMKNLLCEPQGK